jgi:arabinose 5-phosphate isomerase
MLIYGDIIALTLQHALDIQEAHYLQHHPAGSHGIDAQKIIHLYDKIETIPVLPGKKTLYETMEHIQSYRKGYALIVDEASKLLGIFTDGDLRRALLAYADLTDMVSQWMTPNPITLRDQMNVAETKALFKKHKITAAPVLDEKDNILGMIEHFHIGHIA